MNKTMLVARHELATTLGRRSFLFFAFVVPLLAVLIFGAIEFAKRNESEDEGGDETIDMVAEGYVDQAGLIDGLPQGPAAEYLLPYASEEQAMAALEADEIEGYYLIPADFLESGEIIRVYPNDATLTTSSQQWLMRWALFVNLLGGDEVLASLIWNPVDQQATNLSPEPEHDRYAEEDCSRPGAACQSSSLVRMIPAMLVLVFYMFFMISSSLLFNSVAQEKENRTVEIMMVSITPQQMLAGKLIGLGIASLLQMLAWLGSIYASFTIGGRTLNLPEGFTFPPETIAWGIVFFLLGYVMYAGLMAGAGALVPSAKEGTQATLIVMMPMLIAYLVGWLSPFADVSEAPLHVALSLFPLTAPVMMVMRMSGSIVPLWQLLLSAGLIAVTSYAVVRASAAMFRAQYLLSGQSFSAKRYYTALLGRS